MEMTKIFTPNIWIPSTEKIITIENGYPRGGIIHWSNAWQRNLVMLCNGHELCKTNRNPFRIGNGKLTYKFIRDFKFSR